MTAFVSNRPEFHPPISQERYEEERRSQEMDMSFDDVVDTLNPLHHIPIVSAIYREISGDQISGTARVAGGTLFGGPLGAIAGVFDAAVAQEKGDDMGGQVMTAMFGGSAPTDASQSQVQVAQGKPGAGGAASPAARETGGDGPAVGPFIGGDIIADAEAAALAGMPPGGPPPMGTPGADPAATQPDPLASAAPAPAATPTANAAPTAGTAAATPSETGGQALEGQAALQALARDLRSIGHGVARQAQDHDPRATAQRGGAEAAQARAETETQARTAERLTQPADPAETADKASQQPAAPAIAARAQALAHHGDRSPVNRSDTRFMALRPQDYNYSANVIDRERAARRLLPDDMQYQQLRDRPTDKPAAGNTGTARFDNAVREPAASSDAQSSGIPRGDFALRMQEALDKYRKMHNAQ
jgi:hypothetical protein